MRKKSDGNTSKAGKTTRDQSEKARLLRFIAQAHANWQRKMGMIPAEVESEGEP